MGRILLVLCLVMLTCTAASAQTIVRHERTVHGGHTQAAEKAEEGWADIPPPAAEPMAEDEVITVYGPYGEAAGEKILTERQKEEQQQAQTKKADEEAARARLEKFIGQEPRDRRFWLKEGIEENLPYRDCIYMQGGTRGQEDYVIALRRQGNPEPLAPDLCSVVLLVGRGQLGKVALDTEKLPRIELEQEGTFREISFTESRVRLPVAFMLRIEPREVQEIAAAPKGWLLFSTTAEKSRIELPAEVRREWLKVLE